MITDYHDFVKIAPLCQGHVIKYIIIVLITPFKNKDYEKEVPMVVGKRLWEFACTGYNYLQQTAFNQLYRV